MSDKVTFFRGDNNGPPRDSVIPRFHTESVLDELATQQAGRNIFRDEERVQFIMPGNPHQPVERVNDGHRDRWPKQYEAFKRGQEMAIDGTPLEQWPILKRSQVMELKALGLYTVEQCAAMADTAVQKIGMGGARLRELAGAYLDEADAGALTDRLSRNNEALEARCAAQDRQIAELKALVEQIHSQHMTALNAPNAVESHVPGQHDPMEALRQRTIPSLPEPSSLDSLGAAPRRRGRPSNAEIAARGSEAA